MTELENNQPFASNGLQALSIEVGTGTAELQWKKLDGTFATKETYTSDSLVAVPSHSGLIYRVVLNGNAKAALY
jgi:hypothetical protein